MELIDTSIFLLLVMIGAYVQTITGFAMGLLIVGGVTILNIAPIAFTAAVVSILSLLNAALVLRHSIKFIHWKTVGFICIGMMPSLIAGVMILAMLSESEYILLRRILGVVIISAGILLTLKPDPWKKPSNGLTASLIGIAGGIIGGLFSTGGAPIAFFMYRQPLDLNYIRATLLAVFAITTLSRTFIIAIEGSLTPEILTTSAIAIPLVMLTTFYARKISPPSADATIRKSVFILLILIGASLILG